MSKYTSQTISNYNASPPSDDGAVTAANQLTWAKIKEKLADPIRTLAEAINTAVAAALDETVTERSANYTTVAGDHANTIEVSAAVTISLADASTVAAGYRLVIVNTTGTGLVTVDLDTAGDTINGVANGTLILEPGASSEFVVNAAADGYYTIGASLFVSNDAGSAVGPTVITDRASASPAANDDIGEYVARGRNDAGEEIDYASFRGRILDPSDGSEDGRGRLLAYVAGTQTEIARYGAVGFDVREGDILANGVRQTIYAGYCPFGATSEVVPSGWSISRGATGVYTIAHNLGAGTNGVAWSITPQASSHLSVVVTLNATNSCAILITDENDVATDSDFTFIANRFGSA